MTTPLKTTCEECGKEIRGRSDKRFCDDICRNNFNRKKVLAEKVIIPEEALEVVRAIKKNYRLLKLLLESEYTILEVGMPTLLKKGFNPNYFTSIRYMNGSLYRFCFEIGFSIEEDRIILLIREEQLQLSSHGIAFKAD